MSYHSGNELLDPTLLFDKAHLQSGVHMADFGCGRTGQIVFPASLVVGERGLIYAVDILKDVLIEISKRARMEGLSMVHTIWSDVEHVGTTAIPAKSLDVVFVVHLLNNVKDKPAVFTEAARLLKDKGRMIIVDWSEQNPLVQAPSDGFVNFDEIIRWAGDHNFVVQERFIPGKYQDGIVLYRHD